MCLVAVSCILAAGCTSPENAAASNGKITVGVTIPPQAEFVERVGGDRVNVLVMVPPGADPHTYEPKPSQIAALGSAKMYAMVGSGMEFEIAYMDKIRSVNRNMVIVNCSEGIPMALSDGEGAGTGSARSQGEDPHIWVSPRNAKIMVEDIYRGLVSLDPEHQETYAANKEAYLQELDALDTEIGGVLKESNTTTIMVYHPAWTYFCRDYHLTQVSIENDGKEPTPQQLERLIRMARDDHIRVIIAEPEFSTKSANTIAGEVGGRVILLSPLEKNYTENMRQIATAIRDS
ncbi:MAG TPA: zinc ABC transporter substrate-binding protein [Methanomicrobiales archaeon]|nr:zinc ABC transporter substrate-binding protein [Methanomicrobiales archaeon]